METTAVKTTLEETVAPKISRSACTHCHQRKIRCDAQIKGLPCTNCMNYARSDCRLHQKKRKRACDRLIYHSSHGPAVNLPPLAPTAVPVVPVSREIESGSSPSQHETTSAHTPSAGSARSSRQLGGDSSLGEDKTHLVEFIDHEDMWKRPIDKQTRMTYVGSDVSNLNFLVRQQGGGTSVYHYPSNRISRRYLAHEPDRRPVEAFELPDKALVNELLHAYFEKVNPGFPVVDEDIFMAQYRARDPDNPPSLLLLHAVLLVGAHVAKPSLERDKLKAMFFRRAKILFDTRFEKNRDTIVQAALLLTWQSDGPEDIATNAWFWIGVASRTALGLGMHRDASPSTLISHNKRMWRRVWWLLFQCDMLLAMQYGRPQAINLEDCDVQKLQPSDFEGCGSSPAIDYNIQSVELCIILSRALRKVFGPSVTPSQSKDALREVDAALAGWMLLLPDHLRLRPTLTLSFWPSVLHLTYNNALILLHRPRPHATSVGETAPHDADICSAAAGVVQSIFESLHARDQIKYLWTSGVSALFTAMIQLSVEIRISNPILAISALRRYDSTLLSLKGLAACWPNAESVLHFFENSTKLQRPDLRSISDATSSRSTQLATTPTAAAAINSQYNKQINSSRTTTTVPTDEDHPCANNPDTELQQQQQQTDPTTLDPASDHQSNIPPPPSFPDWKLLFPSVVVTGNDAGHNHGGGGDGQECGDSLVVAADGLDFHDSRDEWREIYWQQTPKSFDEIQLWDG